MTGGPAFRSIVLPAEQLSRKSMRVLIRFEEVYSQGDDETLKKKYWRRWTVKQQSSLRWELGETGVPERVGSTIWSRVQSSISGLGFNKLIVGLLPEGKTIRRKAETAHA